MSLWHLAYTCLAKGKYDCTKVDKSGQFANICQIFNNVAADLFSSLKSKLRPVGHSLHWPMRCNAGRLNDWIFFSFFWKFRRSVGHPGRPPMARWTKVGGPATEPPPSDFVFVAVSGLPEHCTIFHFPPSVRSSVRHRRDISTFLDILTVYTIYHIFS